MLATALAGIKVLDLSRLLPGPYGTMLLADMGAEVIKVETPGAGDYARGMTAQWGGGLFGVVNRAKRMLVLDFRHPEGRALLLRLAGQADVFVESFRPGAVTRWGIDYEAVSAANSRIVYCSLSGYGQSGPYANRAGHDLNYLAVGGFLGLNGDADSGPVAPGVQLADSGGGMLAALAIVSALVGRAQTGRGTYLDMAILDAVTSWAAPLAGTLDGAWPEGFAPEPGRTPLGGMLPCYHIYAAADGRYVSLSALEGHFWAAFCRAAGHEDWLDRKLDPGLVPEVAAFFAGRSADDWVAAFAGSDICLEPINDLAAAMVHPQVQHRAAQGEPFALDMASARTPPPPAGAHTRAVLRDAGLDDDEIAHLEAAGIVRQA